MLGKKKLKLMENKKPDIVMRLALASLLVFIGILSIGYFIVFVLSGDKILSLFIGLLLAIILLGLSDLEL